VRVAFANPYSMIHRVEGKQNHRNETSINMSRKVKESIKTALAMVIVYAIALSMGWDRPYWAGLAVALISLFTAGQSLNKGALRMLGTLLAFVASLTIIALFPQARWLFMLALSSWVGFCTYMTCSSKHSYLWFVAGFACTIICADAGLNSVDVFNTAVLRAQETGLGILTYSLVCIYIWPVSTYSELGSATRELTATQRKVYSSYLHTMTSHSKDNGLQALRMQKVQVRDRFNQALLAARTDSYEVGARYGQWQRYQDESDTLMTTLEHWYESLKEVEKLDLNRLLPNLDALTSDLELRFTLIEGMLAGDAPESTPQAIELELDKELAHTLPHFRRAALTATRSQLQHIEELTRSLFETVCYLKGFGPPVSVTVKKRAPWSGLVPDPDHFAAAVRVMAGLWLAYLVWIYTEVPGGTGFVSMTVTFGMALARSPQLRVRSLWVPLMPAVIFAAMLYIFVMPQLSSFTELGLMIFIVTFSIAYLFAAPNLGLFRSMGLAMFVSIISVSNEQSYSFISVTNSVLNNIMVLLLLTLAVYIPFSPQPDRTFMRLLGRFFHSCEFLMTNMHRDSTKTPKLTAWGNAIDTKVHSGTSAEQLQTLTTNLQALTYRLQELLETQSYSQAEFLVQELHADIQLWQSKTYEILQSLSKDPTSGDTDLFRNRLNKGTEQLEARIKETLNKTTEGQLSMQDGENFYRLLGACRGMSDALIDYTGSTDDIDWSYWREARF